MAEWSEVLTPTVLAQGSFGVGFVVGVMFLTGIDLLNELCGFLRDKRKDRKSKGCEK